MEKYTQVFTPNLFNNNKIAQHVLTGEFVALKQIDVTGLCNIHYIFI